MKQRKTWVLLALAIFLLSNVVILGKVLLNRMGENDALQLTERELRKSWHKVRENSGILLEVKWSILAEVEESDSHYPFGGRDMTISHSLRDQLGLPKRDCDDKNTSWRRDKRYIEAWALFEMDGQTWQQDVERFEDWLAEKAADFNFRNMDYQLKNLDRLKNESSRLYLVELAADRETLESKDSADNLISKVVLRESWKCGTVTVSTPALDKVFVQVEDLGLKTMPKHYQVELAIGKLGIPWVKSLESRAYIEEKDNVSKRCKNADDPVQCLISSMLK